MPTTNLGLFSAESDNTPLNSKNNRTIFFTIFKLNKQFPVFLSISYKLFVFPQKYAEYDKLQFKFLPILNCFVSLRH